GEECGRQSQRDRSAVSVDHESSRDAHYRTDHRRSMTARWIALAFVVSAMNPAHADNDDQHITGFITVARDALMGQVTGADGKPVANAKVHLATPSGNDRMIVADGQGRFKTPLPGDDGSTLVYVLGAARITGHAAVPTTNGGTEVVEIHEVIRPSVMP